MSLLVYVRQTCVWVFFFFFFGNSRLDFAMPSWRQIFLNLFPTPTSVIEMHYTKKKKNPILPCPLLNLQHFGEMRWVRPAKLRYCSKFFCETSLQPWNFCRLRTLGKLHQCCIFFSFFFLFFLDLSMTALTLSPKTLEVYLQADFRLISMPLFQMWSWISIDQVMMEFFFIHFFLLTRHYWE